MNFKKTGKIFMVLAIVAVFAFAATSFAGWGRGYGGGGYHMGPGYGMHGGWGPGPRGYGGQGYQSDLSDEDIVKLDKERQAFFEVTSDLRENLYQKELELRSELAKPEPDAKMAAGIQKEISNLESQLESMDVGRDVPPDLAAEISALAEDERINDALARLKTEMGGKPDSQ